MSQYFTLTATTHHPSREVVWWLGPPARPCAVFVYEISCTYARCGVHTATEYIRHAYSVLSSQAALILVHAESLFDQIVDRRGQT